MPGQLTEEMTVVGGRERMWQLAMQSYDERAGEMEWWLFIERQT